jgi:ankyrin repeat-containing protein (fragment)
MANMIEEPIIVWIKQGELSKLEQALLDGYGDHLAGKSSNIPQVDRFLKQVPSFQVSHWLIYS